MAICPYFGDQPFWARRFAALGAGPAPLSRKSLTADALAGAIAAMADPELQRKIAWIAAAIEVEDAVRFIEQRATKAAG
jgi:UDP:flavonoid glycosyltransferase YjiC (YdhE family)